MKSNKVFNKTVATAIAMAVFSMVGAVSPAFVYAQETGARVESAAESNEEVGSSNEETSRLKAFDDPEDPLGFLRYYRSLHPKNETLTSPAPKKSTHSHTKDTAEEDTVQNGQVAEAETMSPYDAQMDSLAKEIFAANAEAEQMGVKKTVYHNDVTAITLPVMYALKACPNVVLDLTYTYEGASYHAAIAGGAGVVCDDTVQSYGPLWLAANYSAK